MKKILFVLLGLVLMFTLVGCKDKPTPVEPDDPVNPDNPDGPVVDDKEITKDNLGKKLEALEKEYNESKKAGVEVNLVNGDATMSVVLVYELGNDGLYKALQYELKGTKNVALYIKDDVVYSTAGGSKSKEDLDATVNETIVADYGLEALLKDVTAFYKDAAVFSNLTKVSGENGVYTFELDLAKYATESTVKAFNTAGKDKLLVIITTSSEKITAVKVEAKEGEKTLSTEIKYLGFDKAPTYPTDLDTYK